MHITFDLLNANGFGIQNIVNCIFDLNNIINYTYDKVEFYCFKDYWKNGWLKNDTVKKYKSKHLSDINIDYSCLNDCNAFLLELKFNKENILDISFFPSFNEKYIIFGYTLIIGRIEKLFENELIIKLAESIKKYFNAKDEIKLMKDPKLIVYGSDCMLVKFNEF